jgi:hypothetical protein
MLLTHLSPQTTLLVWAVVVHLMADWPLQTEWMACNKTDLSHPAGWVHASIHAAAMLLVFPWTVALFIGVAHLLIDTRRPLNWWMAHVKRMPKTAPNYDSTAVWMDQVFHIFVLVLAAMMTAP